MPPVSIDHISRDSHRTAVGRAAVKQDTRSTRWRSASSFIVAADRFHSLRVIIGRRKDASRYVVGPDGYAYRCWRTAYYFLLHTRATTEITHS